jgi:hypothetical protein
LQLATEPARWATTAALQNHATHFCPPPSACLLDGLNIHAQVARSRIASCKAIDDYAQERAGGPKIFETKTMWSYLEGAPVKLKQS